MGWPCPWRAAKPSPRRAAWPTVSPPRSPSSATTSTPSAAPANQKNIQDYLSAYCFGDFYTRKFLTIPERELLTFAVLSAQGGCEPQVKAHVGGNAAVGNGKETLLAALTLCMPYIGFPRTLNALDLGINFFDTANGYSAGTSEEYLGRALKKNVSRDKAVIASKVYFNPGRLSRQAIHREIDGSLKRLGTDYLDLYIIHRFDYDTPMEEPYRPHPIVGAIDHNPP